MSAPRIINLFVAGLLMTVVHYAAAADVSKGKDYIIPKDQTNATFVVQNSCDKPYLWIMVRGMDNLDSRSSLEFGGCLLRLEINGQVLGKDQSVLQDITYRSPLVSRYEDYSKFSKFDEDRKAWVFKFDRDFVTNNQTKDKNGIWGGSTTVGLNHWYAFDLAGIARPGENQVGVSLQFQPSPYYDGVVVGEIAICSLEEVKNKIAGYDRQQISINPEELNVEKVVRERYKDVLKIPEGRVQSFAVKDGYLTKDDKPFFMTYLNHFGYVLGNEKLLEIYNYYGLVNATMAGCAGITGREIMNLPIFLKDGWDTYKVQEWEIPVLLGSIFVAYQRGILSFPYMMDSAGGLPYLEKNFPEVLARYSNGELGRGGWNSVHPNYAHPKYKEFLRQMFTVLARTFRRNPGIAGYSAWEEYCWRICVGPEGLVPQSPGDFFVYRRYLEDKYKTIDRLNAEWKTQFRGFPEIVPPKTFKQTANFVNFQEWRAQEAINAAVVIYRTLKKEDPDHLVMGQKTYGEFGIRGGWQNALDNRQLTEAVDVSRESGTACGRSYCDTFGKVMEVDLVSKQDLYLQWDVPDNWNVLFDQKALAVYPWFMHIIFDGNKAVHWEIYDVFHGSCLTFLHYNKLRKGKKMEVGTCVTKISEFVDAGTADVIVPEKTLKIARAQQWVMRNASLILPARVIKPQVAVLGNNATYLAGYDPLSKLYFKQITNATMAGASDFGLLGDLFDHLHLKIDYLDDRVMDKIFDYKVLIIGYHFSVGSASAADKIKEFVRRGGTVIFYPEAFHMSNVDLQYAEETPGFGLSRLCCATTDYSKIVEKNNLTLADNRFTPSLRKGQMLSGKPVFAVPLQPGTNALVLAKADDGSAMMVSDENGKCFYFAAYLGLAYFQSYPYQEAFAAMFGDILKRAGVVSPMEAVAKRLNDRRRVLPDLMSAVDAEGRPYYLAAVHNFTPEKQALDLRPGVLADGEYDVIDISGEEPLMKKSADGNFHLQPNFSAAAPSYLERGVKSSRLQSKGFAVNVPAYYSKVFLLRQSGQTVPVNCTKEAMLSYIKLKKPLKIVVGSTCSEPEKELAAKIKQRLKELDMEVALCDDSQIKIKEVNGVLEKDGYELEKYQYRVMDDAANLILIGTAADNAMIRHLQTPGNYVYCKVPEQVSADYPGRGKGLLQIAECVNHISYDATDKATDAIMLTGSDRAGVVMALKKFLAFISSN